ncbi:hypothetical protein M8J77_006906 [Diaphorina citri]|nr:hypothetical protein M8J77_006906 [Diaphorina citri]
MMKNKRRDKERTKYLVDEYGDSLTEPEEIKHTNTHGRPTSDAFLTLRMKMKKRLRKMMEGVTTRMKRKTLIYRMKQMRNQTLDGEISITSGNI